MIGKYETLMLNTRADMDKIEQQVNDLLSKRSESSYKSVICKEMNRGKGFYFLVTPDVRAHSGISDILGIKNGICVALELKKGVWNESKPKNMIIQLSKVSSPQLWFLNKIEEHDGIGLLGVIVEWNKLLFVAAQDLRKLISREEKITVENCLKSNNVPIPIKQLHMLF